MKVFRPFDSDGIFTIAIKNVIDPSSTHLRVWRVVENGLLQLSNPTPSDLHIGDYFLIWTTGQKFSGRVVKVPNHIKPALVGIHNLSEDYSIIGYDELSMGDHVCFISTELCSVPAQITASAYIDRTLDVQFLSIVDWSNVGVVIQNGHCYYQNVLVDLSHYIFTKHGYIRQKMISSPEVLTRVAQTLAPSLDLDMESCLYQITCAEELICGKKPELPATRNNEDLTKTMIHWDESTYFYHDDQGGSYEYTEDLLDHIRFD